MTGWGPFEWLRDWGILEWVGAIGIIAVDVMFWLFVWSLGSDLIAKIAHGCAA